MSDIITNRHDVLILFDVTNGNPNGDPDAGNMPRIDPSTNKGLISDVCLKRKIRNFIDIFKPARENIETNGYSILISQGNILNEEIGKAFEIVTKEGKIDKEDKKTNKDKANEATRDWICKEFFDVRTFGGVLSTGDSLMRGSAYGQVRGPVQFSFGQSLHPITPLEITITRCAATKGKEQESKKNKEREIGRKFIVPYGLYAAKCYISPPFAKITGFTNKDLEIFFAALNDMFTHDRSAARGEMVVRAIFDFEHVGTQPKANEKQNEREAALGCYHAHKLFEGIKVSLAEGKEFPESFTDYKIGVDWNSNNIPAGVELHLRHETPLVTIKKG